jgi:hypothetical protein
MLLGFRIPSTELHSAVAMKVVGFYDGDLNTNMVIAPELLVALHGSDFDVDSLFFAKRPSAKKEIRISTKQDIADIITLAQELEEALLDEAFTNHSAHGRVFDALQKIRKGIVSEGPDLTPEEYEKLATPRVLLSIEQDFQQFVKDYNISVKTESNDLAARKKYAELAGLAWLEKKKVDHAVTRHERGLSKDENLIKTSRKWTIRSADSYALFDIRREMFNLAKDENLAEVFPQIKQTLDKILQGIQRERIIPQEIFLKEGDFIGFEKGDDGVYRFNPDYDDYLSTRLRDLRKLEEEAKLSGFKKLEKIIAKQYKDYLA